jgi:prepilin-type N-terminal cleavage/methylation domain-containing protein
VTTERRRESGFTLIELLIVIVILGILAAIVVFAVGNTGKDSAKSACKSDAKTLETAQESYYAEHNNTYAADAAALVTAKYLKEVPNGGSHYSVDTDNTGAVNVTIGSATADYVTDKTACDAAS